jgi:FtsP/CotA-like multicopper oxidase with cupredoxin domain
MRALRPRTVLAVVATLAVLGPLVWLRQASLLPDTYSVMDMGGHAAHGGHGGGRSVTELVDNTPGPADVVIELVAARRGDRFTLNGTTPGPEIRAEQGQVVQVRLVNESVPDGVTLHWHGLDVPNAMDGVAGVTQDAVPVGGEFTYRFVARQAGTFWYHSHQLSHEQVRGGLFGALVITPPGGTGDAVDAVALVHLYGGTRTINGAPGDTGIAVEPGTRVRVRVTNTDDGPMPVWVSGAEFRLVAVDGVDLHAPPPVGGVAVLVTAGGRADLEIVLPLGGARVEMGGSAALVLGATSGSGAAPTRPPTGRLDLLHYGTPAPLGFDPDTATRRFDYIIGRRPGFLDGVPGMWWTINGKAFPDMPMFVVAEGDVVRVHIENASGEVHPMHLHGHHLVVLARDGVAATGSPWWVDTLDVAADATYDVAFVADNPGIWADHCHNLPHAAEGLVAHLMYEGVTTPFLIGSTAGNAPE